MDNGNNPMVTLDERQELIQQNSNSAIFDMFKEVREVFALQANSKNNFTANNAKKILSHFDTNKVKVQSILKKYSDWGLSFVDKDFYILVRGNEVQFPLDYKAYARLAVQNARLAGYDLILEAGVIRNGFKKGWISKGDNGDENLVIANPIAGKILYPWAKYKMISQKTHEVVSSIVEVVPQDEYINAMQSGGGRDKDSVGQIHTNYATEGAKKIALRRAIKHISYMFPHMRDLEIADNEQYNFNNEPQNQAMPQVDPMASVGDNGQNQQNQQQQISNASSGMDKYK